MEKNVVIGVLALQGNFASHVDMLSLVNGISEIRLIKKCKDLDGIHGLIIPGILCMYGNVLINLIDFILGGESTTMGILGISIFNRIKIMINEGKISIWGTCAGLIIMANKVLDQMEDGQFLVKYFIIILCLVF